MDYKGFEADHTALNVFMLNEFNVHRPDDGVHHDADQSTHRNRLSLSKAFF